MTPTTITTEQALYWRRTIEVALLVAALIVIATRWHDAPPTVLATLLALLGTNLAVGQSPMSNVSTPLKRTVPPPPMPAPAAWSEVYVPVQASPPAVPPVPDTSPETPEAKK